VPDDFKLLTNAELSRPELTRVVALDALRDECNLAAIGKGFWNPMDPQVRDDLAHRALGVLDLAAGIEATRKGKTIADAPSDSVPFEALADEVKVNLAKLALIASEVGEAIEAAISRDPVNLAEELADIDIRGKDLAGNLDLPVGLATVSKMRYNADRPHKHGKLA